MKYYTTLAGVARVRCQKILANSVTRSNNLNRFCNSATLKWNIRIESETLPLVTTPWTKHQKDNLFPYLELCSHSYKFTKLNSTQFGDKKIYKYKTAKINDADRLSVSYFSQKQNV